MATRTKGKSTSKEADAVEMLKADHKAVKTLFKQFAALKDDRDDKTEAEKMAIVRKICTALTVHATIEEELFYPAVREAIGDKDLMDEALVEHAGAKELIAQLESMDATDDLFDAKVTVLGEQIDHHVAEEEGDMFPKAKRAQVDTEALGVTMAARKEELLPGMEEDETPLQGSKMHAIDKRPSQRR